MFNNPVHRRLLARLLKVELEVIPSRLPIVMMLMVLIIMVMVKMRRMMVMTKTPQAWLAASLFHQFHFFIYSKLFHHCSTTLSFSFGIFPQFSTIPTFLSFSQFSSFHCLYFITCPLSAIKWVSQMWKANIFARNISYFCQTKHSNFSSPRSPPQITNI